MEVPQLKVEISGVVLPTWLAVCLLITAIFSAVSLFFSWEAQRQLEREIRILQVHCMDIENVLVRNGIATKEDFITRDGKNKTSPAQPKEKSQ